MSKPIVSKSTQKVTSKPAKAVKAPDAAVADPAAGKAKAAAPKAAVKEAPKPAAKPVAAAAKPVHAANPAAAAKPAAEPKKPVTKPVVAPVAAKPAAEKPIVSAPKAAGVVAAAQLIGCFGLTEPDFGSNPTGMITKAKKVPGGYELDGVKRWITNGPLADLCVVWAKLEGAGDGRPGSDVRGFVEKGAKGFSVLKMEDKWSLRASVTGELFFEGCTLPEDAILPNVKGMKGPLSCLSQARYGIAWGVIGAAMSCYDSALSYAKERVQFSRPIAGYQLVQKS